MKTKKADVLLVSFDDFSNDNPILIVGRKNKAGNVDIVNAFQDEDALEIYRKLTTVEGDD